jgi:predicted GNAT family acetyltransferase
MEITVNDNEKKNRFEVNIEGKTACIEYKRKADKIYLTHTEVPSEFEGKGIASSMLKQVLHQIREEGIKMKSTCPFVSGYIERHPEWKDILAED